MDIITFPRLLLDVFFLARAIEGEGCMTMLQPQECATWLVHSVLNRSEKPWWPSSVREQVEKYYHGYRRIPIPSEEAVSYALVALSQDKRVHPWHFMVSQKDYDNHLEWDRDLIEKSFYNSDGTAMLHFLSDWPGG